MPEKKRFDLGWCWQGSPTAKSSALLLASGFEYALVWNEIKVAVLVAWQQFPRAYLLLFGAMLIVTVLLARGARVSAYLFLWSPISVGQLLHRLGGAE